jgi:hypothetical protein
MRNDLGAVSAVSSLEFRDPPESFPNAWSSHTLPGCRIEPGTMIRAHQQAAICRDCDRAPTVEGQPPVRADIGKHPPGVSMSDHDVPATIGRDIEPNPLGLRQGSHLFVRVSLCHLCISSMSKP